MGYLVDYLEQRGYLERRPDPTDRRAALVCLTERGWNQIRAALAIIASLEEDWSRALGARRMDELRALLTELAQATMSAPRSRGSVDPG
jgi:DNA-binding MarR family transcriptional regulator